jgi:precorrin-6B methylase 2
MSATVPPDHLDRLYSFLGNSAKTYKEFCAFNIALQQGLFDVLEHPQTVEQVSEKIGVKPNMTEDLCEILCNIGFVQKDSDGYKNTETSNTLLRKESLACQIGITSFLSMSFRMWDNLEHVWKHGPMLLSGNEAFANDTFMNALKAYLLAGELKKTVSTIAEKLEFKQARTLLDLGGGHGLYSVALCEVNPALHATIFDLPEMERQTKATISEYGAKNVHFQAGNQFTDDLGEGYDVALFFANPGGKNQGVLEKIHRCLKPGGLFVTKLVFYSSGEGSKSRLHDIEWNMTAFDGLTKGRNMYRFPGDLCFEEYLAFLEERFDGIETVEASEFANPPLYVFGDMLDAKIITAKKKSDSS